MQKIFTSPRLYASLCSTDHLCSDALAALCPAHLSNVFASSRCAIDGRLEWWSSLAGHAVAFTELSVLEQQQLLKTLAQRKNELAQHAAALAATDQTDAAQALHALLSNSEQSTLYRIDQQPVLVEWQTRCSDAVSAMPMPPSAADTAALVMAANAATALRAANTAKQTQDWLWLLLLLPLLVLALFIFKF